MTKDNEHGPDAVVERLATFLWNPIDGSGITDDDRALARDALNHAIRLGNTLPNGLEVCQGWRDWRLIGAETPRDQNPPQWFLVTEASGTWITQVYCKNGQWVELQGPITDFRPSHYRPCPAPPRPAKDKERCRE